MNPFELMPLPYPKDALAAVISPATVSVHYGQHHQNYVQKLNQLVKGSAYAEMTLENIIQETAHKETDKSLFNNAAQVWNHNLYWKSLNSRSQARKPNGNLSRAIDRTFGNFEDFASQWRQAGMDQFGSGWIWLCSDTYGKVQITRSANAQNPLTMDLKPLLTLDVWEHAYYLDFQSHRSDYLEETIAKLLNWDFAEEQYEDV